MRADRDEETTMRRERRTGSASGLGRERWITVLLTATMGVSMLQLFLVGALGPRLVEDAGIPVGAIGLTSTAGFGVAALLSLTAGHWVDRLGARRSLIVLLVLASAALALIGAASGVWTLVAALALGGLPQALANPATNKIILSEVEPDGRGPVTGWKQSGVQFGAFAAGLPLAALAAWTGWRGAVWTAAGVALLVAYAALRTLPADSAAPGARPGSAPAPSGAGAQPGSAPHAPEATAQPSPAGLPLARLAAFSFLLGSGLAAVNTYLALFGAQRLSLGPVVAAWLVAALGIAGVAGRVGWARLAGRLARAEVLLAPLTAGASAAALLFAAATQAPFLVWLGAAAVGAFAVAANAVSMVVVIKRVGPARAGRASGLVSAGFFAGFAAGPPLFGLLTDIWGYGAAWLAVAATFALSSATAAPFLRRHWTG
ncbi:MFS transporter [Sinosporangium siamense]|uniref:Major facilitator superfamily (MFS) profile domain-containing protein n=1 Tax=Sinosporangium siamense TaxID=1367973 RepID=A0A919VBZ2_9ACTN|nr:MFS transporter [Sinosporangium siamense]GII97052.1 hypothetical protein Ssi02_72830 [Sinosporangium siamense]